MKLSAVKYVFVMICLFAMMEKTGISAVGLFVKAYVTVTNDEAAKQSNESSESSEAKQVEAKEYWVIFTDVDLSQPVIRAQQIKYFPEGDNLHLSWYPPVATPPPNFRA